MNIPGLPSFFNSTVINHDEVTKVQRTGLTGPVTSNMPGTNLNFSFDMPYNFTGALANNLKTSTTEDTTEEAGVYYVKMTPIHGNIHNAMTKGDICFAWKTDDDMKNSNDIYAIYPIWHINKCCFQKSARTALLPGAEGSKRTRVDGNGPASNYVQTADRQLFPFPMTPEEAKKEWQVAGVLDSKERNASTNMLFKAGYDVRLDNVFTVGTLKRTHATHIPCIVNEDVKHNQIIWLVGTVLDQTFHSSYDSRGRTLARQINSPTFQFRFMTTPDNGHPGALTFMTEAEKNVTLQFPNIDPLTQQHLPFSLPPVEVITRVKETPLIQPFAKITELQGSIPTSDEIEQALVDEQAYKRLMKDSQLKVQLFAEGWGPYNWQR